MHLFWNLQKSFKELDEVEDQIMEMFATKTGSSGGGGGSDSSKAAGPKPGSGSGCGNGGAAVRTVPMRRDSDAENASRGGGGSGGRGGKPAKSGAAAVTDRSHWAMLSGGRR